MYDVGNRQHAKIKTPNTVSHDLVSLELPRPVRLIEKRSPTSAQTCQDGRLHTASSATLSNMILRIATLNFALELFRGVVAGVAPEITTVADGYNLIAKLPCIGCAFLYQDTSKGENEAWTERKDDNALVSSTF